MFQGLQLKQLTDSEGVSPAEDTALLYFSFPAFLFLVQDEGEGGKNGGWMGGGLTFSQSRHKDYSVNSRSALSLFTSPSVISSFT